MNIHYKTQGFIFKKIDVAESDRSFFFFTKDFGRIEILAKAERKIQSKLRGGLEIFNLVDIEFIQGKTHKTLTDIYLTDDFRNIKQNLGRLKTAYEIAGILDDLIRDEGKDKEIWSLLLDSFKKLDNLSLFRENYFLIYYLFLWNLFSILGYGPEIYHCVVCQKRISPGKLSFSAPEGGVICSLCSRNTKKAKAVSDNFIKILRLILKKDWATLSKLKFDEVQKKLLKDISNYHLSFITEQN